MIRIYIAAQQGTGTSDDPYRSILNDLIDITAGDWFDEIDNPARRYSICCVHASQATHDAIIADGRAVPATPLLATDDAQLSSILDAPFSGYPLAWRNAAQAKLEANGINTAWITGSNTLRDVLQYLLRMHSFAQVVDYEGNSNVADFLRDNLDMTVGILTAAQRNAAKVWMQAKGLDVAWIVGATTVRQVLQFVIVNLGWGAIRFAGEVF